VHEAGDVDATADLFLGDIPYRGSKSFAEARVNRRIG
jgi:hypothetical protein